MSHNQVKPEQLNNDATEALTNYINPRTAALELKRLRHFHEDLNSKASHNNNVDYYHDTIRGLIARAADHIDTGQTVNFMQVITAVVDTMPELQGAAVRFINDVSSTMATSASPRLQAYFSPTAVLGVWRRNSFRMHRNS